MSLYKINRTDNNYLKPFLSNIVANLALLWLMVLKIKTNNRNGNKTKFQGKLNHKSFLYKCSCVGISEYEIFMLQ